MLYCFGFYHIFRLLSTRTSVPKCHLRPVLKCHPDVTLRPNCHLLHKEPPKLFTEVCERIGGLLHLPDQLPELSAVGILVLDGFFSLNVDSNTAPKMVGLMTDQSKFSLASTNRGSRISSVNIGISMFSSLNSPPFTYGNIPEKVSSGRCPRTAWPSHT